MIDDLFAFLAKSGFKEPLHPPITHMPIGLAVGALIFFLIAIFFKRKNLVLTARHVSILAFIFAFPTIILGVIDWIRFYNAALFTPIIIKMVLALIILIVLGAGIIVGSEVKIHSVTLAVLFSLAVASAIGLGYFGSGIIYGRGLEIKKHNSAISNTVPKSTRNVKKDTLSVKDSLKSIISGDSTLNGSARAR